MPQSSWSKKYLRTPLLPCQSPTLVFQPTQHDCLLSAQCKSRCPRRQALLSIMASSFQKTGLVASCMYMRMDKNYSTKSYADLFKNFWKFWVCWRCQLSRNGMIAMRISLLLRWNHVFSVYQMLIACYIGCWCLLWFCRYVD